MFNKFRYLCVRKYYRNNLFMNRFIKITLTITFIIINHHLVFGAFIDKVMQETKKAVVTIKIKTNLSIYGYVHSNSSGTGCIVNKVKGIVVTNKHIANPVEIATYEITFYTGQIVNAKLIYSDPWIDYSFLKIDPKDMPKDVSEIEFIDMAPQVDQPVFIIGNNQNNQFSIHNGTISNVYDISGSVAQHSILTKVNTKGGSSGSPIVDMQGKAVALNYASSSNFGIGLHPGYVSYALKFINKGQVPLRKHIGAVCNLYSLNDGVKYRNFPKENLLEYIQRFPDCMTQALQVKYTLPGSPASTTACIW